MMKIWRTDHEAAGAANVLLSAARAEPGAAVRNDENRNPNINTTDAASDPDEADNEDDAASEKTLVESFVPAESFLRGEGVVPIEPDSDDEAPLVRSRASRYQLSSGDAIYRSYRPPREPSPEPEPIPVEEGSESADSDIYITEPDPLGHERDIFEGRLLKPLDREERGPPKRLTQELVRHIADLWGVDLNAPLRDDPRGDQPAEDTPEPVTMENVEAGNAQEWTTDANDCTFISLLRAGPKAPVVVAQFNPDFTYPIFGERQEIHGYQGLQIHVRFASHDLRPNLLVTYRQRHAHVTEDGKRDVKRILRDWIHPSAYLDRATFEAQVQASASDTDWTPPGKFLDGYRIKDATFEVWCGNLSDPVVRETLDRIQFLVPCLIEGGSLIKLSDPDWSLERWTVYFLYEKLAEPKTGPVYSIVGYCTAYRYYYHSPREGPAADADTIERQMHDAAATLDSLPGRARISQFMIFTPFQHRGHGTSFYHALFEHFLADPTIKEVAVEDPNESFDDLRDFCDLTRLRRDPTFRDLRIDDGVRGAIGHLPISSFIPVDAIAEIRRHAKIADRQFKRLVEMQLLTHVSARVVQAPASQRRRFGKSIMAERAHEAPPDERYYGLWRKFVKQRLLKHNLLTLAQLELDERIEQLEQVMVEQEEDYFRLLRLLRAAAQNAAQNAGKEQGEEAALEFAAFAGPAAPDPLEATPAASSRGKRRRAATVNEAHGNDAGEDDEEDGAEVDDDGDGEEEEEEAEEEGGNKENSAMGSGPAAKRMKLARREKS